MGILKSLFGSKAKEEGEEKTFELVEQRIPVEQCKYEVRLKFQGGEIYVWDFFHTSKDLSFSRFYVLHEKPLKPHFAPSLEQALIWFRGEKLPKDGYGSIFWGRENKCQCFFCDYQKSVPFRVSRVECLVIYQEVPAYQEIAGWRVGEVESEVLGKGIPTKFMELSQTHAIIRWESQKEKYVCERCAQRLQEVGRQEELQDYVMLPGD